jgi:ABC-type multidrug transport system ATPase subunit
MTVGLSQGPSGAGKSTLIDVILGRKTAGRVVGDVRVCGVPQGSTRFSRLVGYVSGFRGWQERGCVGEA